MFNEVLDPLVRSGVDLPYPTTQVLLHDQTEEWDGDRARQREGWPIGAADVPPQASFYSRASKPSPSEPLCG